jgi:opacity protein-like surface antigen
MSSTRRFWRAAAFAGAICVTFHSAAFAQPRSTATQGLSNGYVEVVAHSAFGNVTSQSYGGEIGYRIGKQLQIFVEGGQVRDVATDVLSTSAQAIAGAIGQVQPAAVSYSVKQPVTFFAAGLRYPIAMENTRLHPYVLGGFGAARVKNDVTFQLGGVDASSTISQYVTLGEDLSGSQTKPMFTAGAGVVWPAYKQLIVDFQFRYGRVFNDEGISIGRAGIGIGVQF